MTKKDFDSTLKALELTRADFCALTGLAYSSVGNWNDENKPIPQWVDSWLKLYKKAKNYDMLKSLLREES